MRRVMKSHILRGEQDLRRMRDLLARLPGGSTVADLEELLLQPAVRATVRLWCQGEQAVALALVDSYNNLQFDLDPQAATARLEAEIVDWGLTCMRRRNAACEEASTLDASCQASDTARIALLERHGFRRQPVRSLHYVRSLATPLPDYPLPDGFSLRPVQGEAEVEDLVALHRAAFGTEHMTVEERLAIMRAPLYEPELDRVAVAPGGELAAFCICGFVDDRREVGYTDPVGTHPRYQRRGLGKAMVSAGLRALRDRGARTAEVGTGSENLPMQRLAAATGFSLVSESVWFSRTVP